MSERPKTDVSGYACVCFEDQEWEFTVFRDKTGGVTVIIDSPGNLPESTNGPRFRAVLNDDWENPIWENR